MKYLFILLAILIPSVVLAQFNGCPAGFCNLGSSGVTPPTTNFRVTNVPDNRVATITQTRITNTGDARVTDNGSIRVAASTNNQRIVSP